MLRSDLKNLFLLAITKFLQLLFPLLIVKLAATKLSLLEFGVLAFGQSLAIAMSGITEYGFNYIGARDIGVNKDNSSVVSKLISDITQSKLLLSIISACIIFIVILFGKFDIIIVLPILLISLGIGFSPIWYFQGIEDIRIFLTIDLMSKFLSVFCCLLLTDDSSGTTFLTIIGVFGLASSLLTNIYVFKSTKSQLRFELHNISKMLRVGFSLFLFRSGAAVYTGGATALLGLFVGPSSISIYSGADRIFRAALAGLSPIGEAFFPKISFLERSSSKNAEKLRMIAMAVMLIGSLATAISVYFLSDQLIILLLGENFIASSKFLKILSINIFLVGIGTSIFVLYLLPKRMDIYFGIATLSAACFTILGSLFFVPREGIIAFPWIIIGAEACVILVGVFGCWKISSDERHGRCQ